jgi:hypothetical protein
LEVSQPPLAYSRASPGVALPLVAGYAAAVLLHLLVLSPYFQMGIGAWYVPEGDGVIGLILGDASLYRLYAESLLHLEAYSSNPFYPPAYPLVLAAAELLSPTAPIQAMIVANIAVASAVMFPVYLITRQILGRDLAFGAAIVAAVLPASFIFAPALMSENLSTTLFVTASWLALRRRPVGPATAALFGAVLGLCFLTKYLFLTMIPLLGIAFMINQWLIADRLETIARWTRMVRIGLGAAAGVVVPVALWSAYLVASGGTVARSLGIHVASAGMVADLPPLAFLPPVFGLHGLALIAIALPLLPAVLIAIHGCQRTPVLPFTLLLGTTTAFMWLFVTVYAWTSLELFGYPQPICERYFMMLVPLFVPLAFVGLQRLLDYAWCRWRTLATVSVVSMALSLLVQAGLYDRTIWPIPEWTTVIWVGAPDVLYGALGFPVVAVTAVVTGVLLALATAAWLNRRSGLLKQHVIRVGAIVIATAGLALFNVAVGSAGARFAWDSRYLELNAAHGRAITEIIGDRRRDARPASISIEPAVLDTIAASTGVRLNAPSNWWVNLSFWSGRWITVVAPDDLSEHQPHYWVSIARSGADPATIYRVGGYSFQVTSK